MHPVKFASAETVYRGSGEVGDLWCERLEPGVIRSVWEPTEEERAVIAAGGRIVLTLASEPIPPISMQVATEQATRPVGEHPFKIADDDSHAGSNGNAP